ncbi:MAG: TfoX/Sxy family protein [Fidelibacterota bacterium]
MGSDEQTVIYIVDQIESPYPVRYRKMFGEYAIYINNKVVALVCANILYVKKTTAGIEFAPNLPEAPPYPGGKPALVVEEKLEDRDWLSMLLEMTERALPAPK